MQILIIFLTCLVFYGGMMLGREWYKDHTFEERAIHLGLKECCDENGSLKYKDIELHYKDDTTMKIKYIIRYLKNGTMKD